LTSEFVHGLNIWLGRSAIGFFCNSYRLLGCGLTAVLTPYLFDVGGHVVHSTARRRMVEATENASPGKCRTK